jgi:hypothetical protein
VRFVRGLRRGDQKLAGENILDPRFDSPQIEFSLMAPAGCYHNLHMCGDHRMYSRVVFMQQV